MTTSPTARLRSILSGTGCLVPAPVYDPITARLAQSIGFEMGMVGGSSVAASVLAAPDLILLTLTELADQIRRMTRASALPLLIDADHGYGNALNVMRCVNELELAGAAGMTLEDTHLPAQWHAEPSLIAVAEAVDKLTAAIAARTHPDFVIVARTSLSFSDLDDVVQRAKAYAAAGADAIFIHGSASPEALDAIGSAAHLPLIVGSGGSLTPERLSDLAARNVKIALPGHQPLHGAIAAMDQALRALRDPQTAMPALATPQLRGDAVRQDEFKTLTARYLKG